MKLFNIFPAPIRHLLFISSITMINAQVSLAAPLTYTDIAPILLGRCAMCHMPNGMMGAPPENYRLDSYAETISTTDRARVVPGNALASELYRRVIGHAKPRMPFNGPPYLSEPEIEHIGQWINDGARDANGIAAAEITGARIRLHGTLNNQRSLNGLNLVINSNTRIKKNPSIGDYVQVRGSIGANAEIIVDRIKRK